MAGNAWSCSPRVVPCRRSSVHSPSELLLSLAPWLHPPLGRVAPLTVVDDPGRIHWCLPCHLADRDGLAQVTRGDRDDRVDVAAVRAALSAWNGHVMVRQPVAGPVEAWHALRRGLEHVVGLKDACLKNNNRRDNDANNRDTDGGKLVCAISCQWQCCV